MQKIAQFEKVSFEQFIKDWIDCFPFYNKDNIKKIYDNIKLPQRATSGSAGYDFYCPMTYCLNKSGEASNSFGDSTYYTGIIKFPTGIRCKIEDGWALNIYPRSGQGFKYGLRLANTVGVIDCDYYNSDNEGHIFVKFLNDSCIQKDILFSEGQAFCQGIFTPYGVTYDDNINKIRNGGFGSTNNPGNL